jgi:hypothetical protein
MFNDYPQSKRLIPQMKTDSKLKLTYYDYTGTERSEDYIMDFIKEYDLDQRAKELSNKAHITYGPGV